MELIIVILFFSIASVVCVQLFVNAYKTNQSTKESSQATLITQSLAEGFMGCGGDIAVMGSMFNSAVIKGNELYLFYDNEWNSVSDDANAAYVARLTADNASDASLSHAGGNMTDAVISVYRNQGSSPGDATSEILTQNVTCYEQYRLEDIK